MNKLPELPDSKRARNIRKWKRFGGVIVLWFFILGVYVWMQTPPNDEVVKLVLTPDTPALRMFRDKLQEDGVMGLPYLPLKLEIESASNPIKVFVLSIDKLDAPASVERMQAAKDEILKTGEVTKPDWVFEGTKGAIALNWFPYGKANYFVLIKPESEVEVKLRMRYTAREPSVE